MAKLATQAAPGFRTHRSASTSLIVTVIALLAVSTSASAIDGPFVGLNLGGSQPVNNNYRAHVEGGVNGSPYVGYMFNEYFGLQFDAQLDAEWPDNDHRGFSGENQMTTVLGYLAGPRLQVPTLDSPWGQPMELYLLGEFGGFTGLSGRLTQTSGGLSAGAGLDIYLTDHIALSIFGRYNRAFQAPRPKFLIYQAPDQADPADAQWATGGLGVKYRFNGPPAAPPPPPPAPPVAAAPPEKKKIVLRGVNFDFDKSNIRPDARPVLDEAINTLKEYKQITLSVEGHTDSIGSAEYNDKLSLRRAKSVADYLEKGGIDAKRLTAKGLGESQPVASNDTAEGRAQNRRVELKILQGP